MEFKNFEAHLKSRLSEKEIACIKKQAKQEYLALKALQKDVVKAVEDFAKDEDAGFNELVRRFGLSPTQVNKIRKGEANLTISTIARLAAIMKKKPHIVFA